jgi:hypothetical protein
MADADLALTASQANRHELIVLTGSLTAPRLVTLPANHRRQALRNATSGGQAVTVGYPGGGAVVAVAPDSTALLVGDGTDLHCVAGGSPCGGSATLAGLDDVDVTAALNGDLLRFDGSLGDQLEAYQSHLSIDRAHGLIRKWDVTDAARYEGAMLRDGLLDKTNTASSVWADSAYRSRANETFLDKNGFTSKIHRKEPKGRPMPRRTARANARKSAVRARVEHVFGDQKERMNLCVRTIGLARAELKIGMADLVYNIKRTLWLDRRAASA